MVGYINGDSHRLFVELFQGLVTEKKNGYRERGKINGDCPHLSLNITEPLQEIRDTVV